MWFTCDISNFEHLWGIVLRNNEDGDADSSSILPGEIFKLLQNVDGRTARDCAIRLRTSSEYLVANAYGDSLREDKKYKGLYHVARMEKADAFAFDFDFSSKTGFGDEDDISTAENNPPILQMAFEYTITESILQRRIIVITGEGVYAECAPQLRKSRKRQEKFATLRKKTPFLLYSAEKSSTS